jgi:hypothetical protein
MLFLHHKEMGPTWLARAYLPDSTLILKKMISAVACAMLLTISWSFLKHIFKRSWALDESNAGFRNDGLLGSPNGNYSNIAPFDAYISAACLTGRKRAKSFGKAVITAGCS